MKTNKKDFNHWNITSNFKNRILKIQELKKLQNTNFDTSELIYKNSFKKFKKEYKKDLKDAKLTFIKNNAIFKLCHFKFKINGRLIEQLQYLPIYSIKN